MKCHKTMQQLKMTHRVVPLLAGATNILVARKDLSTRISPNWVMVKDYLWPSPYVVGGVWFLAPSLRYLMIKGHLLTGPKR